MANRVRPGRARGALPTPVGLLAAANRQNDTRPSQNRQSRTERGAMPTVAKSRNVWPCGYPTTFALDVSLIPVVYLFSHLFVRFCARSQASRIPREEGGGVTRTTTHRSIILDESGNIHFVPRIDEATRVAIELIAAPHAERPWDWDQCRDLEPIVIPFLDTQVWVGARRGSLTVFPDPKVSLSVGNGSGAIYLARSADKERGWLLQVLPPATRTSRHLHRSKSERFIPLFGGCRLGLGDGYSNLHPGESMSVPAGVFHHLRAEGEAALNLLIIRWSDGTNHATDPLVMEDHHYEAHPLWA